MKLENLKNQKPFYCPSFDKKEALLYNSHINKLKKDIKIIKNLIKTNSFDINNLSNLNLSAYTILIDQDLDLALKSTKYQLGCYLQKRFYLERASKYLTLTGNFKVDKASINMLEQCRYLLANNEATIKEIKQILPTNHKFNLGENK